MKAIVFIPYFGKLPQYFEAFLHSVERQSMVDFLVFTDDPAISEITPPVACALNRGALSGYSNW